jgi:aldose 1-epimerase
MARRMVALRRGAQRAELDLLGGRVVSYRVAGQEVLAHEGPPEAYRGSLLVPWPNRVALGRWHWNGEALQLPINDQPSGNALHGLVAHATFRVESLSQERARLSHDLAPSPGYPFALQVVATYALTDAGLACQLEALATGDTPTPLALGVHPYLLTRGSVDDVELSVPAEQLLEVDRLWEEQDRVAVGGTGLDLRSGRLIGDQEIDACWTAVQRGVDGRVRCRLGLPGGDEVVVWAGSTARYVVVYTSHTLSGALRRTSIAIEPQTGPPNALRSGTDLDVLRPGESLALDWGLQPSWLSV